MVFIRKEFLAKRLENFGTKSTETICIEFLISKRNGALYSLIDPQNRIRRFSLKNYQKQ